MEFKWFELKGFVWVDLKPIQASWCEPNNLNLVRLREVVLNPLWVNSRTFLTRGGKMEKNKMENVEKNKLRWMLMKWRNKQKTYLSATTSTVKKPRQSCSIGNFDPAFCFFGNFSCLFPEFHWYPPNRILLQTYKTWIYETSISWLLFNHSSHLDVSHSNSNSWATRRCTVAQILPLFNLSMALKQPWMRGTKSGVQRLQFRQRDGKWVTFCVRVSLSVVVVKKKSVPFLKNLGDPLHKLKEENEENSMSVAKYSEIVSQISSLLMSLNAFQPEAMSLRVTAAFYIGSAKNKSFFKEH